MANYDGSGCLPSVNNMNADVLLKYIIQKRE